MPSDEPRHRPAPEGLTPNSTTIAAPDLAWLREHAIPFATAEPGNGVADLQPLRGIVGDARIVALGEATHGTHEFFAMKHRLLEFLVAELGFTAFAIEATWPEATRIDDYVRTGQGDPATLLASLRFWTCNTREMLDLVRWMRAYNERAGAAPRLSFHGLDVRFPRLAIEDVLAYVRRVDPPAAAGFAAYYRGFQAHTRDDTLRDAYPRVSAATRAAYRRALERAYANLRARRAFYEAASSPRAYALALEGARVALQGEAVFAGGYTLGGMNARDRAMAENAVWVLEEARPGAKLVLWGHNGHVSVAPHPYGATSATFDPLGAHLRARYGDAVVALGFAFHRGAFNAVGRDPRTGEFSRAALGAHQAPPPPPDSYETGFHQVGLPRMLLDLRGASSGVPGGAWLLGPRPFRSVGAVYDGVQPEAYLEHISLPRHFDAVIYFHETRPSALLPDA